VRKPRLRLGRLPLAFVALAAAAGLSIPVVAKVIAMQAPPASAANCNTATIQSTVHMADGTVDSAALNTSGNFTRPGAITPITGLPAYCDVNITQTDSAGNAIHIVIWLPEKWNGDFQGLGGSEYSCGISYVSLALGIREGYSTAATDCGHTGPAGTGSWALNGDGTLNDALIKDFASAGIHDMSVVGKAVTKADYTRQASYSYFNGCSTGGREGLLEARRYPADYNGIVAGAPAINWTKFIPSEIWPELVMNSSHDFLPSCKENAFVKAAVKACDAQDGVTDGVIADPAKCDWNPDKLVGSRTRCGAITRTDAAVVEKIFQGPTTASGEPLWYGLERGASLTGLAGTITNPAGGTTGNPFSVPISWLGTWLQRNPNWNWRTLTYAQFDNLFQQSVAEFSSVLAMDNPDLTAFKKDGGKILIWHGLADQIIFPQGTINYYQRVQQAMGGPAATDSFARLFLAPGAQHCASAAGPAPADPLGAVVNWVQHGKAPASILGTLANPVTGAVTRSRQLCMYPLVARYTGHGSTNDARNFTCAQSSS
jgi:tannase/feruloyl esterase